MRNSIRVVVIIIIAALTVFSQEAQPGSPVITPEATASAGMTAASYEEALAVRVIDGDTIELADKRRVRYIGINTPELGSTKKDNCFGDKAMQANRMLVEGKWVSMKKDVSETDRYGRLLRYVYVGDVFVNEKLVRDGYAQVSTFPPDVYFQDVFIEAEREAREQSRGLWDHCK